MTDYEFGGPIGAAANVLLLPVLTLCLCYWASIGRVDFEQVLTGGTCEDNRLSLITKLAQSEVLCPSCGNVERLTTCALVILCWFMFQVGLERFLPCQLVEGAPLPDNSGRRLTYRINGHLAFWMTLLLLDVAWPHWVDIGSNDDDQTAVLVFGRAPFTWLYDNYSTLAFATIIWTFVLSTYLYLKSFGKGLLLAAGGNSGSTAYDFFLGRELNPRWGSFDWKEFCELRPGLIGWMLLNIAMLAKQYERLGYVTGSMILVNLFQGVYVWDALYQEKAILTTMDITTDGFGFMLCFGDLGENRKLCFFLEYRMELISPRSMGPFHVQLAGKVSGRSRPAFVTISTCGDTRSELCRIPHLSRC